MRCAIGNLSQSQHKLMFKETTHQTEEMNESTITESFIEYASAPTFELEERV
jgi:hypothetical protein